MLATTESTQRNILNLHVSEDYRKLGIGSASVQALLETYPESEFSVIPSDGPEDFFGKLGFVKVNRWEMRRVAIGRKGLAGTFQLFLVKVEMTRDKVFLLALKQFGNLNWAFVEYVWTSRMKSASSWRIQSAGYFA